MFEERVAELGLQLPPWPLLPKGVAALPLNLPVIMSAALLITP
jgi:hypothetical protein